MLRFAFGTNADTEDAITSVSEDSVGCDRGDDEDAACVSVFCVEGTACVCVPFCETKLWVMSPKMPPDISSVAIILLK